MQQRPFHPLFGNPHLSTIAGNFWPRSLDDKRFPVIRRLYQTDAQTRILVLEHQPIGRPRGQVVFLHGLEGSADAGYIQSLAQEALMQGYGVHRKNLRSCGGTEELCETMYHSGLTADTYFILREIYSRQIGPVFLVGFSLGGNVALKLAGEVGESELLGGVCAISTPIDLAMSVKTLDRIENRLYAHRFLDRLRERVTRKSALSPHLYATDGLNSVRTIWEFDDRFTAPLFGFGTAENYYATQSAARFLHAIRLPTLVITAKDDPLVPFEMYLRHPAFQRNPALNLLAEDRGGHLGFLSRSKPRFWLDQVVLDWMRRLTVHTAAQISTVS